MTLAATTPLIEYLENGATLTFAVPFQFRGSNELLVRRISPAGAIATEVLGADYTVAGGGGASGSVTMTAAKVAGWTLRIERKTPREQATNYAAGDSFAAETHELALDRAMAVAQEIEAGLGDLEERALRLPLGRVAPEVPAIAPSKFLGSTALGGLSWLDPPSGGPGRAGDMSADLKELTPYMFREGVGLNNAETDTLAVQACIDEIFDPAKAHQYKVNLLGRFRINRPMFMAFLVKNDLDEPIRHIELGTLSVVPVAEQAIPIVDVLTVHGVRLALSGGLWIDGGIKEVGAFIGYTQRRFTNGVRWMGVGLSYINCAVRVDGARRHAQTWDESTGSTLRAGTPYELSAMPEINNIGATFPFSFSRCIGSYQGTATMGYTTPVTAAVQGALTAAAETSFVAGGGVGNPTQRTRLTVGSTAEFKAGDWGWRRVELTPAHYTTIAADNAAGTFTFGSGNLATLGLRVGSLWAPQSGVNAGNGILYEIISITGQVVKVNPKPATEAATAITGFFSAPCFSQIKGILSATEITVCPWSPDQCNSVWYSSHGCLLHVPGRNTANTTFGMAGGFYGGVGLAAYGLYAPNVQSFLPEYTDIGLAHNRDMSSASLGLAVDHMHFEACLVRYMQQGNEGNITGNLAGPSDFYLHNSLRVVARPATDQLITPAAFVGLVVQMEGVAYQSRRNGGSYSGSSDLTSFPLSNAKHSNFRHMPFNGFTATVDWDDHAARCFGETNHAKVIWVGPAGAAPSGTATFNLSASMQQQGWTFSTGGTSLAISAMTKPTEIELFYHKDQATNVKLVMPLRKDYL